MPKFKIKREELDYILTDCSPEELSEAFSYVNFYNYLCSKDQFRIIDSIFNEMASIRGNFKSVFEPTWSAKPLDFYTVKNDMSLRELSLLQPISLLNVYYYVRLYGSSLLKELNNPVYSIRYHTKSNQLYYKGLEKDNYFSYIGQPIEKSKRKRVVEQTGSYFKVIKYKSILDFGSSDLWEKQCIKFKYFCKIDYKNCFPSIYSHSFNWIITCNTIDSKNLSKKPSLYSELDRTLQNINGKITNGIVVGPEFSRMSAELLLQKIDLQVESGLKSIGLFNSRDYSTFRFVDDIYIFGKTKEICDQVVNQFDIVSNKYKLSLNSLKIIRDESPLTFSDYQVELNQLLAEINTWFTSKNDKQEELDDNMHYLTLSLDKISRVRRTFDTLVHNNYPKAKTYSSYVLSTLLNHFYSKPKDLKLFSYGISNAVKTELLGTLFHIYCPYISFQQTQKFISIISLIQVELGLPSYYGLQKCINMYSQFFKNANVNDYINLLLVLPFLKTYFPSSTEECIFAQIKKESNPVNLATFLIYSHYNKDYFDEVVNYIELSINNAMSEIIRENNPLLYKQFWFLIVFNKCPHISASTQAKIDQFLSNYQRLLTGTDVATKAKKIVIDFMINSGKQFMDWNPKLKTMDEQIVFRTHYKTIFRKKKRFKRLLTAS